MQELEEVNEYRLDPGLLAATLKRIAETPYEDDADPIGEIIREETAAHGLTMHEGTIAIMALCLRITALSRFLEGAADSIVGDDGVSPSIHLDEHLMRCAVEEPIVEKDGPIRFDHLSFVRRLIRTATVEPLSAL